MENFLGTSLTVFIGLTCILFGGAAYMTGRALALTWRPMWQAVPYSLLLAAGARFLTMALFQGELLSLGGYLISALFLLVVVSGAYRLHRAWQMVTQYPWLYERAGPFSWREARPGA